MMLNRSKHWRASSLDAGFSLVEVLVSLALLAMILALLPGAFRTGKRGWETSAAIDQRASSAASIEYLRHRIAEATPVFDKDESGRSRLAFSGGPQSLSFVAPAPSGPIGGGLYRFKLQATPQPNARTAALTLSMTPFRQQAAEPTQAASEHLLMPGVEAIRLQYFGVHTDDEPPVWSSAWLREDRLPAMIELQTDGGGNGAGGHIRIELKTASGL